MSSASGVVRCAGCSHEFGPVDGTTYGRCPACNDTTKITEMTMTATVTLSAHGRGDAKSAKRRKGKPEVTRRFGDEFHRDSGTWRRIDRTVDRTKNRYTERIVDAEGEVVREVDEPLDQHKGRGNAKEKRPED